MSPSLSHTPHWHFRYLYLIRQFILCATSIITTTQVIIKQVYQDFNKIKSLSHMGLCPHDSTTQELHLRRSMFPRIHHSRALPHGSMFPRVSHPQVSSHMGLHSYRFITQEFHQRGPTFLGICHSRALSHGSTFPRASFPPITFTPQSYNNISKIYNASIQYSI